MARSNATTVEEYLLELPDARRAALSTVREVILRNLPGGYRESMEWGVINYSVPLERYSGTYNGQPLCFVALAAQKHYLALYLMCAYQDPALKARLEDAFREAGKKLDMGKSCVRFKAPSDIPLEAIGRLIADIPMEAFLARYEAIKRR